MCAHSIPPCAESHPVANGATSGDRHRQSQPLVPPGFRLDRGRRSLIWGGDRRAVGPRSYPSEEPHLDSGALLLLSSPRRGGEGGEALDGNVSNTWQDGGQ